MSRDLVFCFTFALENTSFVPMVRRLYVHLWSLGLECSTHWRPTYQSV